MKQRYTFSLIVLFALLSGFSLFIAAINALGADTPQAERDNPIYMIYSGAFALVMFGFIIYALFDALRPQNRQTTKANSLLFFLLILNLALSLVGGHIGLMAITTIICFGLMLIKGSHFGLIGLVMTVAVALVLISMFQSSFGDNVHLLIFSVPILVLSLSKYWLDRRKAAQV